MAAHNRFTTNAGRGRDAPIQAFKVTDREKAAIAKIAHRFGLSASEWCRYRALNDGPASAEGIQKLRESGDL